MLQTLKEYEGIKFQRIAKNGFKLDDDEEAIKAVVEEFKPLTEWMGKVLKGDVEKVCLAVQVSR